MVITKNKTINLNKKLVLELLAEKNLTLVAVTKNMPIETIKELVNLGVKNIGENKVQEFEEKCQKAFLCQKTSLSQKCSLLKDILVKNNCKTHFIGHLQSNKAKKAVELFDVIQSIDSEKIARKVDYECKKSGKVMDVMIQVNISKESQKQGIPPENVVEFYNTIKPLSNLNIIGLMCIASDIQAEQTRQYFKKMKELFDEINSKINASEKSNLKKSTNSFKSKKLTYLSMGMSNDYHVAIEEGANMIRLGRGLFG